ncbi:DUF4476 domain-containing protein [Flaviaesturariibacter aridisoli]|uniref:DUF4476 domain-containing protein n=1 Tax=Flaviaesturariibacter aridisoli TaxID=2545761 RepID=A0A4R4DVH2_9BACT|nr:DUF4476 domain-containing protein [Flaviaesturariibacter aridisoli]TCZ67320.1 DUF4476 domain-containing protein [Flaviaesturariibacter aridisoli]
MRTIFTLLLAIAFTTAMARPYDEGRLTITFAAPTNLVVQIDNRYYNPEDNVVYVDHIPAGRHTVRVYSARNGRGNVLYTTQVQIRPYTHVDVTFNRFGRAYIDERRLNGVVANNYDPWGNDNYNDNQGSSSPDWSGGWGNNGNGGNNSGWGNNGGSGNGYGNGGYNSGNGGYNNGNSYGAMNTSSFNALLQQVRAETFDNTKLTIIKDALATNRVTAVQVKQLMQLFTFDNDRLELAKAAYPRTTDKNNYFQVNDAFEFSSSKESLSTWIRNQRP